MLKTLRKWIPQDHWIRRQYHKMWAIAAAVWYGFPAKRMVVIGVTGTDGKTTTSTMVYHLLQSAGLKTGLATSVTFAIGDLKFKNTTHKTTLGRFGLQKILREMANEGCSHCVIETSSHALSQHRVWGIPYDIAVITNVSPEHLDYHRNLEQYTFDKARLFKKLMNSKHKGVKKTAVINFDDGKLFSYFSKIPAEQTFGYGVSDGARVRATDVSLSSTGSVFQLHSPTSTQEVKLPVPGDFNISNALAAASVGLALGIEDAKIKTGLESFPAVPGRMERIDEGQPFDVYIDYAMTPEGYSKVLSTAREITKNKLWVVFGCCGDRDKSKRPVLGKLTGEMCDRVIITDDEPYSEDSLDIIGQIESGIKETDMAKDQDYFVIVDRRRAIEYAMQNAEPGDVIIIPGMGDLEGRTVGTKVIPWNEREVVRECLKSIK